MTPFSHIGLREIRDIIVNGSGREIEKIAHVFGPLRDPFDGFMALIPVAVTEDPAIFGIAVETCGFRQAQHFPLDAFRAAGIETDGLPECGVYIAAPFAQPA